VTQIVRPDGRWFHWIVGGATLLLLGVAARTVDWARAWDAIAHADAVLIGAAVAANLGSIVVKAFRWSLFLHAAGVRGVRLAVHATFAGAALNNLLVANGGDAARVVAVARRADVSSASVLATLAIDRLCDLATYIVLFVGAAFVLPVPSELARWRLPGAVTLTGLVLAVYVVAWWSTRHPNAIADATSGSPTLLGRAHAYGRRLVRTSAAIATRERMLAALALALLAWGGQWATFHVAAHAASLPATPAVSLLALLTVNASFLVRLTPGNVGIFQFLYVLAATSAGLDRDQAVAVAFLISVIQYIPVMLIGLLLAPSLVKPAGATASGQEPRHTGA